jgi:hypothetical protein
VGPGAAEAAEVPPAPASDGKTPASDGQAPASEVTARPPSASESEPAAVMPAVVGLSLRQAMALLAPLNVPVEVAGRGVVTAQAPPRGTVLGAATVCQLTLASPAGGARARP